MRTFSLGAGADTVVFADAANKNGKDTITGFKAGSGGDVLDVRAWVGASISSVDSQTGTGSTSGKVDTASGAKVVVLSGDAESATNIAFTGVSSSTKVIVIKASDSSVYFYTASDSNSVALSSVLSSGNQVATLTGVTATDLTSDNFLGN